SPDVEPRSLEPAAGLAFRDLDRAVQLRVPLPVRAESGVLDHRRRLPRGPCPLLLRVCPEPVPWADGPRVRRAAQRDREGVPAGSRRSRRGLAPTSFDIEGRPAPPAGP